MKVQITLALEEGEESGEVFVLLGDKVFPLNATQGLPELLTIGDDDDQSELKIVRRLPEGLTNSESTV